MDIHKPKAAHSIREFAIEIGTIICGILIALGLEQGIEQLHWRYQVEQTDERLGAEVRQNLEGAYMRVLLKGCYNARLVELRDALLGSGPWVGMPLQMVPANAPKSAIPPLQAAGILTSAIPPVYVISFRSYPQDAWNSAIASTVALHMKAERASAFTGLYRNFDRLRAIQEHEVDADARLSPLSLSANLTEADRRRYLEMIGELNSSNIRSAVIGAILISQANDAGVRIRRRDAELLVQNVKYDPRFSRCYDPVKIPLASS